MYTWKIPSEVKDENLEKMQLNLFHNAVRENRRDFTV